MKVIFLDIDGVLNSYTADYSNDNWPWGQYEPAAVGFLNELTDLTGAKIVISSTWRLHYTLDELREGFRNWGVTGEIIDMTSRYAAGPWETVSSAQARTFEIFDWLADNPEAETYVSLDDIDMREFGLNQVKTSPYTALIKEDVEQAIKRLGKDD